MSRKIVVGIIAGALVLGGAACSTEVEEKGSAAKEREKEKPAPAEIEEKAAPSEVEEQLREEQEAKPELEEEVEDLITPELIVDMTFESNPGFKQQFCGGYELLGYKLSLRSFESGYGHEPGYPPARVVFKEVLSRC